MDATTKFNLPIPETTDDATVPAHMGLLADAIDTELGKAGAQSGKSIINTEQFTTSTSPTYLGTPDRIQNLILETDGLISIAFQANWVKSQTVADSTAVALPVLNGQQIYTAKDHDYAGVVSTAATRLDTDTDRPGALWTTPTGLATSPRWHNDPNLTTGQVIGGIEGTSNPSGGVMTVFAAAGTYEVGIMFYVIGTGYVTVKNRRLWAWVKDF